MPKTTFEQVPLNPAHRWLLSYFQPPFEWFDSLSFTITSRISIKRVEKTIQALVKRHSALRTEFVHGKSGWQQKICNECAKELLKPIIVPGEGLSAEQLEKLIEGIKLAICKSFRIDQLPLFRFVIVEMGRHNYTFHVFFHHIIVDYLSIVIFIKEFYHLYFNENAALSSPVSNSVYSQEIQELEKVISVGSLDKYIVKEDLAWLGIHNQTSRPSAEMNGVRFKEAISHESSEVLLRSAKTHFNKSGLHAVLAAPLYRAIKKITDQTLVCVSHKLLGREIKPNDIRFFSSIGNFAVNTPVSCEVFPNETWNLLIDRLEASLNEDQTRNLIYDLAGPRLPAGCYPDQLIAPVRFYFMGSMSFQTPKFLQIDFHKFAQRVTVPEQILTTFVEFFVYFSERQLFIEVVADRLLISETIHRDLTNNYIEEVNNVVKAIKKDGLLCQSHQSQF